MRFAPKSYIHEIIQRGGFALLFEEQMYPFGHSSLLAEVQATLGLKVLSPRDVRDGESSGSPDGTSASSAAR